MKEFWIFQFSETLETISKDMTSEIKLNVSKEIFNARITETSNKYIVRADIQLITSLNATSTPVLIPYSASC